MFSNQSLEKNCSRIPIEKFLIHWTYIASEFRRSGVKGIKVQTERCGFKHWWSMKCCWIGRHFSPARLGPCCSKYERTYQGQARVLISCLQLFSEVLLLNIFSFDVANTKIKQEKALAFKNTFIFWIVVYGLWNCPTLQEYYWIQTNSWRTDKMRPNVKGEGVILATFLTGEWG